MPDRYVITLGAPTTAGGKVTSARHVDTIDGIPIALEGDTCWCPACRSEGVIRPAGPRVSNTFDGRELALADDLCICKCSPPPRLIAAQDFMVQSIDSDSYEDDAAVAAAAAAASNAAGKDVPAEQKMPLVLLDPDTQEPLRNRPYRLELADRVIEGRLDYRGWTEPLTAAERAGVLSWQPADGD
ncbi:PAAR domain-containing protein [Massilia sp. GCM10023247]|uniref:PAAR domain-containing protein n=1 Tax=Massilia sp. GCM10023247 TaxID=3252643 RepID=UPI0036119799